MKRHWLIRHNNKTEYVPVYDIWQKQVEQVNNYCISKGYNLKNVLVIETATKHVYSPLLSL